MAKKSVSSVRKTEVSAEDYRKFVASLKSRIRSAQIKGAIAVNRELVRLYWEIGRDIAEKQEL